MTTELFGENSKDYVQNAPLYPFRYYQSYKAVKESNDISHNEKMKALEWLEGAMSASVENLPDVLDDTFVAVDTSGSMRSPVSGDSDLECVEISTLFGALLYRRGADVAAFASDIQEYHGDERDSVISIVDDLMEMPIGGGTSGELVPKALREYDRDEYNQVIVFTDMQMYGETVRRGHNSFKDEWDMYKSEVNPDATCYMVDLNSYGDLTFPEGRNDVVSISGWTSNIIDFIESYENREELVATIEQVEPSER